MPRRRRCRSAAVAAEVGAVIVVAEVGYYEPWWIQILKALVIFVVGLQLVPVVLLAERKLLGRFQHRYGPNRVGPFGVAAADGRHRQAALQGAVPPAHVGRLAVRARAGDLDPDRGRGVRDHPVRRHASTSSAPRSGSTAIDLEHRDAVRVRVRRDRLLRADARRLGVGLEVLVPGRDALRRAADLLRGLPGPGARRRGDDGRHAVADGDRRGPGGQWYFIPQFVGFVDLPRRRLRGDQPRRRSTSPRPTPSSSAATTPSTAAGASPPTSSPSTSTWSSSAAIAVTMFFGGWLLPFGRPADVGRPDRRAREDAASSSSSSSGCARRCRACATTS